MLMRRLPLALAACLCLAAAPGLDASEQAAITQLVRALTALKSDIDSGHFLGIQQAAIAATGRLEASMIETATTSSM